MKKLLILLSLFVLIFPNNALAHGGQEKRAGSTLVILYSDPISPLVGEKVKMGFTFVKEDRDTRLKDLPVTLTVVDTFYGDVTKDRQIFQTTLRTDANGVVLFEYTFPKENFFDVELKFKDQEGQDQTVGFLIQAREKVVSNHPNPAALLGAAIIGGLVSLMLSSAIKSVKVKRRLQKR